MSVKEALEDCENCKPLDTTSNIPEGTLVLCGSTLQAFVRARSGDIWSGYVRRLDGEHDSGSRSWGFHCGVVISVPKAMFLRKQAVVVGPYGKGYEVNIGNRYVS